MAQKSRYASSVTFGDTFSLGENWQKRKPRMTYTDFQHEQMEKAFRKSPYLKGIDKEALASNIGLSPAQIQNWFKHRRAKHQQERQAMAQSPSSSHVIRTSRPRNVEKSVHENEYMQQISALRNELDLERIKSASLSEQLNHLRSQLDNVVFDKNRITQELEKGYLTIRQLNDQIRKLKDSNQNFKKSMNANIWEILQ